MSYYTHLTGRIEITPAPDDDFTEALNDLITYANRDGFAVLYEDDAAPLYDCPFVFEGGGIESAHFDQPDEYEDWLAELVALVALVFPESRFDGAIHWDGEETADYGLLSVSEEGSISAGFGLLVYGSEPIFLVHSDAGYATLVEVFTRRELAIAHAATMIREVDLDGAAWTDASEPGDGATFDADGAIQALTSGGRFVCTDEPDPSDRYSVSIEPRHLNPARPVSEVEEAVLAGASA